MVIYADWNATTPMSAEVAEAMRRASETAWANPSSVHAAGRAARAEVERARTAVASLIGCDPRDVVLTGGGTEANNIALRSLTIGRDGRPRGVLVTARSEHPSVLGAADALAREGVRSIVVDPEPSGRVSPDALEGAIDAAGETVACVSLQTVNHETGVIQPIADVAAMCQKRSIAFHTDAVQAAGRLEGAPWAGADVVTVASHKIRGPKGVGAIGSKPGTLLLPVLRGGAQERGIRPGTVDAVACAGFAVAVSTAAAAAGAYRSVAPLRDQLEGELVARFRAIPNGTSERAPHVANLSFDGWLGPELVAALDLEGVCVSSGAACSAGTAEPSAVITAMLGHARSRGAVRISLGPTTTRDEIAGIVAAFERVLARAPSQHLEIA